MGTCKKRIFKFQDLYDLNELFGNQFTMGKSSKRYSFAHIVSHSSKADKYRRYQSATSLDEAITKKQTKIRHNFRRMIRRLMAKQGHNKETYMISFLNIMESCEDLFSLVYMPYIPSIENMMSHNLINPNQEQENSEVQSRYSFTEPISSSLLEAEPQIPIYFMCLLEKVFKLISCPLTKDQNQAVVKGTWNILIKYWKDNGHALYKVNEKVEWGLLELLSFRFGANKKERFEAQQRLRMTLNDVESNLNNQNEEDESISQRSYFCTLQHIE